MSYHGGTYTATQLDELVIKIWFVRNALNNVDVAGMRQTLKTGLAKQIYSCTKGCWSKFAGNHGRSTPNEKSVGVLFPDTGLPCPSLDWSELRARVPVIA